MANCWSSFHVFGNHQFDAASKTLFAKEKVVWIEKKIPEGETSLERIQFRHEISESQLASDIRLKPLS